MERLLEVLKGLWSKKSFRVGMALFVLAALLVTNLRGALDSMTDVSRMYADEGDEADSDGDESGDEDEDSDDEEDQSDDSGSDESDDQGEPLDESEEYAQADLQDQENADPGFDEGTGEIADDVQDTADTADTTDTADTADTTDTSDTEQGDAPQDETGGLLDMNAGEGSISDQADALDDGVTDVESPQSESGDDSSALAGEAAAAEAFESDAEMEEALASDEVHEEVSAVEEEVIEKEKEEKSERDDYDPEEE